MAEDERTGGPTPPPVTSELLKTIDEQKAAMIEQGGRIAYKDKHIADLTLSLAQAKEQREASSKWGRTWEEKYKVLEHLNNQLEKTNRLNTRVIEKLLGDEDLEL